MACGMYYLNYLANRGVFLAGKARVFDVGSQNLLVASPEEIIDFVNNNNPKIEGGELEATALRFSKRSQMGQNDRTLYLGEVLDLTSLDYVSIDIYQGHKTRIFDLNFQDTPTEYSEAFDVVLNFGTTEHVFNQYNSFKIMHEAAKPGAYLFHQVPSVGYIDHGYFMYSPRTFVELADANGYELLDLWFTGPQGHAKLFDAVSYRPDIRSPSRKDSLSAEWDKAQIPNAVINVLLRKKRGGPFRLSVDATTSAGAVVDSIARAYSGDDTRYESNVDESTKPLKSFQEAQIEALGKFSAVTLARELRRRILKRLRAKLSR